MQICVADTDTQGHGVAQACAADESHIWVPSTVELESVIMFLVHMTTGGHENHVY